MADRLSRFASSQPLCFQIQLSTVINAQVHAVDNTPKQIGDPLTFPLPPPRD